MYEFDECTNMRSETVRVIDFWKVLGSNSKGKKLIEEDGRTSELDHEIIDNLEWS